MYIFHSIPFAIPPYGGVGGGLIDQDRPNARMSVGKRSPICRPCASYLS